MEGLDGAAIERVATGSGHRIVHDALRYGADKFGIHIEGLFLDMMYRGLPGFVAVQVLALVNTLSRRYRLYLCFIQRMLKYRSIR